MESLEGCIMVVGREEALGDGAVKLAVGVAAGTQAYKSAASNKTIPARIRKCFILFSLIFSKPASRSVQAVPAAAPLHRRKERRLEVFRLWVWVWVWMWAAWRSGWQWSALVLELALGC